VAVASLLSLNDSKLDGLVTAYCQQYGIGSRVASFLVLENDTDYKRFNLEEERGRTHAGDLGTFLDEAWRGLGRVVSSKEAFGQFLARIEPRVNLLGGVEGPHVKKLLGLLQDADYELPEAKLEGKLLTRKDVPAEYLARRDANVQDATTYLTEARRRADTGDAAGAVSALSSLVELYPARGDALRLVGYRLLDLRQAAQAVSLFRRVQEQRPFEPHSYRDLARSLEESGRYGLAALQYEIVLAGNWHNRFHQSLKLVALEEYGRMMRDAIAKKAVGPDLANHFGERLEKLDPKQFQSDLRVTMSWNTDNTDVDLWVIEPDGTKCFYQNRQTPRGGELTEDMTQGYGPERYQAKQAQPGVYRVVVHYFRPNPNLMAGETHVNVVVTRNAGTPQEKVERHTVILKRHNEEVEVCQIKF
jgi:tetratricopeptide (TPR) repeat protein